MSQPLKVIFEGEEGIDAGGVTKEFFQLLVGQLFSLEYGTTTSLCAVNTHCTYTLPCMPTIYANQPVLTPMYGYTVCRYVHAHSRRPLTVDQQSQRGVEQRGVQADRGATGIGCVQRSPIRYVVYTVFL